MWIVVSPGFIKFFTPKLASGITIFPFIILKKKELLQDKTFVYHELIHIRQQAELLFLIFVLLYGIEFIVRLIQYKNFYLAYRNISFEREAYANESNYNYLKTRKWLSFIKYWKMA
jgi:hypothetical protein